MTENTNTDTDDDALIPVYIGERPGDEDGRFIHISNTDENEDEEFTKLIGVAMAAQQLFEATVGDLVEREGDVEMSMDSMHVLLNAYGTAEGVAYASSDEAIRQDVTAIDDELLTDAHTYLVPLAKRLFGVDLDLPPNPAADDDPSLSLQDLFANLGRRGS